MHPLDNPVRFSLLGAHAHFAERQGEVLRYPTDMSPFVGLPDPVDDSTWPDVAKLCGPDTVIPIAGLTATPPPGWEIVMDLPGVQMLGETVQGTDDDEAVRLGADDVPEMMALVAATQPGPFAARTYLMGDYLGIRRDGALVAMAGERLHPEGFTEISAVCTDSSHRGQGLAGRLVQAVAAGIRRRGEVPFLHAAAPNANAIRLYASLGFTVRRDVRFAGIHIPGA